MMNYNSDIITAECTEANAMLQSYLPVPTYMWCLVWSLFLQSALESVRLHVQKSRNIQSVIRSHMRQDRTIAEANYSRVNFFSGTFIVRLIWVIASWISRYTRNFPIGWYSKPNSMKQTGPEWLYYSTRLILAIFQVWSLWMKAIVLVIILIMSKL